MHWAIILGTVETLWVVTLCAYIVLQKRRPIATLAWILALAALPIIGIAVYIFLGPRRLQRKRLRRSIAKRTIERATNVGGYPSGALDEALQQLALVATSAGDGPPLPCSELRLLASGDECYAAMETAIKNATHHIHLSSYIFDPDQAGEHFLTLLAEKAKAGVEVRLLVDALGSQRLSQAKLKPLREAGGHCAYFNPFLGGWRPRLVNFRSHRKILICDGAVGFTGGMNITEAQAKRYHQDNAWRDCHLEIGGQPVRWLQKVFLEDWHFATGHAPVGEAYLRNDLPGGSHLLQIVSSGPDEQTNAIEKMFFTAITTAKDRLWITTPYFVPTEAVMTAMETAAMRGVDIKLLTPAVGDSALVTAAGRSFFDELIAARVRVYEYQPTMLHAKTMVADNELAFVGTANMDNRSFELNFEVMAVAYGKPLNAELAAMFERDLEYAKEISALTIRKLSLYQRVFQAAARLFAPVL